MPYRKTILATGEIYHIFNRSVYNSPILKGARGVTRFSQAMVYYLQPKPSTKFSFYIKHQNHYRVNPEKLLLKIIAYCFMPTHFHFLVRQEEDEGIRKYFQRLANSYSHYFNLKNKQKGPLFESPFKAVRVENDKQLLHLSRYIHLNPVSDFLVEDPKDYPYSSYAYYLNGAPSPWLDPSLVISQFSNSKDYEKFVLARKDYQRELTKIKHLLLE